MRTAKTLISLADAQADLSFRWAHNHFFGFFMSRLIWSYMSDMLYSATFTCSFITSTLTIHLVYLLLVEILGEALRIRIIIIIIQNRRLVPPVSLVRPTFAGNKL